MAHDQVQETSLIFLSLQQLSIAPACALCLPPPPSLTGHCLSLGPHSHRPVFSRIQETLAFSLVKAIGLHEKKSDYWMQQNSMDMGTGKISLVTLRQERLKVSSCVVFFIHILGSYSIYFEHHICASRRKILSHHMRITQF